jgi:hypothetical protein
VPRTDPDGGDCVGSGPRHRGGADDSQGQVLRHHPEKFTRAGMVFGTLLQVG